MQQSQDKTPVLTKQRRQLLRYAPSMLTALTRGEEHLASITVHAEASPAASKGLVEPEQLTIYDLPRPSDRPDDRAGSQALRRVQPGARRHLLPPLVSSPSTSSNCVAWDQSAGFSTPAFVRSSPLLLLLLPCLWAIGEPGAPDSLGPPAGPISMTKMSGDGGANSLG